MLSSGLVHSDLGANHHMWTQVRLDTTTGQLDANTRTATFTWFGGYTGGVQVALLDAQDFIIARTGAHRFGVDGTWIGKSDQTQPWGESIPIDVVRRTVRLQIFHFWAPNWSANLDKWLSIGKSVGQAIAGVVGAFGSKAATGQ